MNVYDGNTWKWLYAEKGEVPSNKFTTLQSDPDGNLIGIYLMYDILPLLVRYENGVWTNVKQFYESSRLYVDRDKKLWYGNYRFKDRNTCEDILSIVNWQNIRRIKDKSSAIRFLGGYTFVDSKGYL